MRRTLSVLAALATVLAVAVPIAYARSIQRVLMSWGELRADR